MGFETRISGSSGQCLTNWARQESVGQEISEVSFVCFMHHFTCWTLFISRINRAWLYKDHEDSGWQLNVDLAQLVRHWPHDLEVLVSNHTGGNFWRNFFCSSLSTDLSDNLTETPIVKNSKCNVYIKQCSGQPCITIMIDWLHQMNLNIMIIYISWIHINEIHN